MVGLMFVYFCALLTKSRSTGYIFVFLYHVLGLALQFIVIWIEKHVSKSLFRTLDFTISSFLPCYCMSQGFLNLYKNFRNIEMCNNTKVQMSCQTNATTSGYFELYCCKDKCGTTCLEWEEDYFDWEAPGIGKQVFLLPKQALFFLVAIIIIEMKLIDKFKILKLCVKKKRARQPPEEEHTEYNDFVHTPLPETSSSQYLLTKGLTKYIRDIRAINSLTFGVNRGECFGLIGMEDSGKTTTVKVITGEWKMSSGKVYIDGEETLKKSASIQGKIGICPENDALLNYLTGEEILEFYAKLRGIPKKKIRRFVGCLTKTLALEHYIKQRIKEYSSSSRRKLSVAVALIGTPPMIVLDEPTANMDPTSCKFVWNTLLRTSAHGCTILLTTDRMDECESVCHQIGILANGRLVYIGSLNDLRKEFGGYSLVLNLTKATKEGNTEILTRPQGEEIKALMERNYPQAILKAEFPSLLHYYFPYKDIKWSDFFGMLEKEKREDRLQGYSIGETTLDTILFYASLQGEMREKELKVYRKRTKKRK